ncbi:hypothetical protein V1525DRAFT_450559 [Lipomyces kononenkoae]|uniref:Uncharacterized protein n=1 Tax=Lipomyces kononenkoae TaxID=34357 RepID=A0ACC3T190_LIPKO
MDSAIEGTHCTDESMNRYCSVCIRMLKPDQFLDQYGKKSKTCNTCRRKERKISGTNYDTIGAFIASLCRQIHQSRPNNALYIAYNLTSDLEWKGQSLHRYFTTKYPGFTPPIFTDIVKEIYNFRDIYFVTRTITKDKSDRWRLTYLCARRLSNRNNISRRRVHNTAQRELFECGSSLVIAQLDDGIRIETVLKFMWVSVKNSRLLQDLIVNEFVEKPESLLLAMESFMSSHASGKVRGMTTSQSVSHADFHHIAQQPFGSRTIC